MTVCIAALCGDGTIFGATDRMLTAGDVEFEPTPNPPTPIIPGLPNDDAYTGSKMVFLTKSIVAMTAGDAALQAELMEAVELAISNRIQYYVEHGGARWLGVREVAEMYRACYQSVLRERAAHKFLAPMGLDYAQFLSRQREFSDQFVKDLSSELANFDLDPVAVIFAGVDLTGSHIYSVTNDSMDCHDSVGFATIGSGGWHAQTQFMLAGHDRKSATLSETLFLTYLAKKRSEVAPGVGEGTDMFIAGPLIGRASPIFRHVIARVENIYQTHVLSEKSVFANSRKEAQTYVEEIQESAERNQGGQSVPAIDDRTPPADGSSVQNDVEKEDEPSTAE